jgi:hypothetical protein
LQENVALELYVVVLTSTLPSDGALNDLQSTKDIKKYIYLRNIISKGQYVYTVETVLSSQPRDAVILAA